MKYQTKHHHVRLINATRTACNARLMSVGTLLTLLSDADTDDDDDDNGASNANNIASTSLTTLVDITTRYNSAPARSHTQHKSQ